EGWGKAKTPSPLHSLSPNTTFSQQNDITLILLRKKQGFSNSLAFAGISPNSGSNRENSCVYGFQCSAALSPPLFSASAFAVTPSCPSSILRLL
ncbi:hypothetical protein, partial [Paenibacillus dendritiformis]|uniref:hypothetical protein n=1 Tax=Paenibacillus dendritiformis TaxID=130049 RepID=UPI001BCC8EC1